MVSNPFETFDQRLNRIEKNQSLILGLLHQPKNDESKEETEQLITFDELAQLLHISKTTAYSNYSKGLIPGGCKQGKRVLFDKKVVLNWVKSGRKLSNAEIEQQAENYLSNSKKERA